MSLSKTTHFNSCGTDSCNFRRCALGTLTTESGIGIAAGDVRFSFRPALIYLYACHAGEDIGPILGGGKPPKLTTHWNDLISRYGTVYADDIYLFGWNFNLTPHPSVYDDNLDDNFSF